jgi:DNA-binding MarR family transcriptional regulator
MRSIRPRSAPRGDPSKPDDVIELIVRELRGALKELRRSTAERIIRQGVSMTQIHVLWLLDNHGELPMSRLAELLAVSPSNSSGLIDRMVERQLVERRRVQDDRRLVVVGIGPEGSRLLRELEEVHHDGLRRALGRLEPQRLAAVLTAFSDFRAAIEADLGPQRSALTDAPATAKPATAQPATPTAAPSARPASATSTP